DHHAELISQFAPLYKRLILGLRIPLSKEIIIHMLEVIPPLPKGESTTHYGDLSEMDVLFNIGMLLYALGDISEKYQNKIPILLEHILNHYQTWASYGFYSPANFVQFFRKLHQYYQRFVLLYFQLLTHTKEQRTIFLMVIE